MKIGIFDSGIGGLSVLYQAFRTIPAAQFVYYADEAHVPYGERTRNEIRGYVREIIGFLLAKDVDAIVIACNTATSVADRKFRAQFPVPIIGMEPAVKKAVELYGDDDRRILVAATPVTISGNKLHNLVEHVDVEHNVDLVALPGLVKFAEQLDFTSHAIDEYLQEALSGYELDKYSTLVLGCTHFNYFKAKFKSFFPKGIHFIDGNEGTINQLMRIMNIKIAGGRKPVAEYYFSGRAVNAEEQSAINRYQAQLANVFTL